MLVADGSLTRLVCTRHPPLLGEGLPTLLLSAIDGKKMYVLEILRFHQPFRLLSKEWITVVPPQVGEGGTRRVTEGLPRQFLKTYARQKAHPHTLHAEFTHILVSYITVSEVLLYHD